MLTPPIGILGDFLAAFCLGCGDDLRLEVLRYLLVIRVLHVVRASTAGRGGQVLLVRQHLGHRHLRADHGHCSARVHAGDPAAPAVEVAHQVAGEVARRIHLDLHDRFEDGGAGARHRILERE